MKEHLMTFWYGLRALLWLSVYFLIPLIFFTLMHHFFLKMYWYIVFGVICVSLTYMFGAFIRMVLEIEDD